MFCCNAAKSCGLRAIYLPATLLCSEHLVKRRFSDKDLALLGIFRRPYGARPGQPPFPSGDRSVASMIPGSAPPVRSREVRQRHWSLVDHIPGFMSPNPGRSSTRKMRDIAGAVHPVGRDAAMSCRAVWGGARYCPRSCCWHRPEPASCPLPITATGRWL